MLPTPSGSSGSADRAAPPGGAFGHTRWSIVLAARDPARATVALEELCRLYWPPLYAYVRRRGHDPHTAEDLTQEFFARLLARNTLAQVAPEKGKFRSFLLAALKHFLANEWDKARARKRGGGLQPVAFDTRVAEDRLRDDPAGPLPPDRLFDRQWALVVLELALDRLAAEHDTPAKQRQFAALRGTLTGDAPEGGYAGVARQLALTEGAVKVAVHRLRKRYRDLLRAEVAQTVADPRQVAEELRALFAAFQS